MGTGYGSSKNNNYDFDDSFAAGDGSYVNRIYGNPITVVSMNSSMTSNSTMRRNGMTGFGSVDIPRLQKSQIKIVNVAPNRKSKEKFTVNGQSLNQMKMAFERNGPTQSVG